MEKFEDINNQKAPSNQEERMEFSLRFRSPNGASAELENWKGTKEQWDSFQRGFAPIAGEMNKPLLGGIPYVNQQSQLPSSVNPEVRQLPMPVQEPPRYHLSTGDQRLLPPVIDSPVYPEPIALPPGGESLDSAPTVIQQAGMKKQKVGKWTRKDSVNAIEAFAWTLIGVFVVYSLGWRFMPEVMASIFKWGQPQAQVQPPKVEPKK